MHDLTGTMSAPTADTCAAFTDLAEEAHIEFRAADAHGPTVGDHNSHNDLLTDPSGREIGTIVGNGWKVYRRPDGHVISYYQEEITLDAGTIRTSGWMDSTAVWSGAWQSLHAVGIGGDLLGMVGVRQIRQVRARELFTANIVLCSAPARG
ncbi:allene oxide cyclase barrel-like domain-containing protein [Amycolatopsis bartoniae]|uniref:allene oxide cyclase barrel-like domain-containing protein n=1 Tax=Amycolatopsis bartoniae TaxID=941986 RepID=UPI0011AB466B|nr:hypothetical protein [Amycolatopsis bartoniae]